MFHVLFTNWITVGIESMDHSEAVQQMAAERYLLDELTPDVRDAFEEHVFDCPECALDLRAGAAFVDEAKVQLPELIAASPAQPSASTAKPIKKRDRWFSWWSPAFAIPAFATMLIVIGYQNLVTLPELRTEANQPRLLPWVPLHGATRGGAATTIAADREHGVALPIDLSGQPGAEAYASYSFDLFDSQGKLVWTGSIAAPAAGEGRGQRILVAIPGAMLRNGAYTVAISGVGPHGERTAIEQTAFNLLFTD
jgi:Putative zinc-finger